MNAISINEDTQSTPELWNPDSATTVSLLSAQLWVASVCDFLKDEDGRIYAGDVGEANREHLNPPKSRKRKANRLSNRRVIDRGGLQAQLRSWILLIPLRAVRPATYILDGRAIKTLSTVHPDRLTSVSQVVAVLEETDEWS
ncbi:hypothetical protein B0H13DRAFT_2335092 [Mycena leptocephala]|nr:hypothetical protein B0H13DRAFT_2335092 [Mycena leptocephala]